MDNLKKRDGTPAQLGEVLSRGGEGFIHDVPALPWSVAKIWREPSESQARKLDVLLSHPPNLTVDLAARFELAWPSDALYDDQDVMQGYLMPKVPLDEYNELVSYCIPAARKMLESDRGAPFSRYELLTIARNLSEMFGRLHDAGYVIGDVNHTNFLVRRDGKLFMIDLDSVQATDPATKEVYRCTVGKEDFTPPRLMGLRFDEIDRTYQDDLFGLAVLLFQMMMDGQHPYDPVDQTGGQGQVRRENIKRGHSPYVNLDVNQAKAILDLQNIPDAAIREQQRQNILALIGLGATADFDTVLGPRISTWLELEPELRDLFSRAFGSPEDGRPDSAEWISAIDAVRKTIQPVAPPSPAQRVTPAPPSPAPPRPAQRVAPMPSAGRQPAQRIAPAPPTPARHPSRIQPIPPPHSVQPPGSQVSASSAGAQGHIVKKNKVIVGLLHIFLGPIGSLIGLSYVGGEWSIGKALVFCLNVFAFLILFTISSVIIPLFYMIYIIYIIVGLFFIFSDEDKFDFWVHRRRDHVGDPAGINMRGKCLIPGCNNTLDSWKRVMNKTSSGVSVASQGYKQAGGAQKPTFRMKICPYCAQTILYTALKCRYCKADL